MAVRTVSVLLTADITAFRARMGEASRTSARTSRDIRTSMRDAGRTMTRVGENQKKTLNAIRGGSLALVAAFGFAVAASARFEKAMSNVKAVSQASGAEMAKLRSAALEMGRTTAFSAVQAAEAEHELAKAGVTAAEIAGGALKGALNLAAAAEIDVAEGAEIAANAMTVFGLKGRDVGHIADVLAAAANKSTTDVHQMGMSLRMAGQVASQTGLSLEDTVGALTLFAAEGLKGSDAGTSFKVMLQRLTPQSKEAQATMDKLGFSAYDAGGNFVGLQEMARRMQESFKGLTPEARNAAMGIIFGSDAVRAANILYKYGADGVRTYTDAVNDQGYAQAVAMTRMDNLIGDFKLLKAAIESALIESGSSANSALRDMVQWVTRLVNVYNGLPPELQSTVGLLTGMVGVIGLAGSSMLLLLPRIMVVRRELIALGVTAAGVRAKMMTLGQLGLVLGTLAAIGWGISKLADQFSKAPPNVTKLTNALVDLAQKNKASGELTKAFGKDMDGFGEAVARIAHPSVLKRVKDVFSTLDPFRNTDLTRARDDVKAVDDALAQLVQSGNAEVAAEAFKELGKEAESHGTSTQKLLTLLPQYAEALAGADTQAKLGADSQGELGDATAMTADQLEDQRSAAEKLTDALNQLNGVAISAAEGQINFEQSLDDLSQAVKDNGTSLDVTSEKGRDVKSKFLDAAKAAQEYAQAVADQKGSVDAGNMVLEDSIGKLRRTMTQAGFTKKQIDELIGAYAQLPPKTTTQIIAETGNALHDLEAVQGKVSSTKGKTITVDALTREGQKALEELGFKISNTKGKKVTITVPTGTQKAAVDALKAAIDALKSKQVTITTTKMTIFKSVQAGGGSNQAAKNAAETSADGNIFLRRFAQGGMTENHIAQIARPGTWRVWAEDETGGEAYIPLAPSKRARSRAIAEETVRQLGGKGILWYASGGTTKKTPQSVINARREVPGDLGEFTRSLTKSASDISSASKTLVTDLKKLGNAGWKLAGNVDVTSRKLQSLAAKRDQVREQIAAARQFATDQAGKAKEFMELGGGGTANELITDLKQQQAKVAAFQRNVELLKKKGLHKDLLAQVIEEGPGGTLAQRILTAAPHELRALNDLAARGARLATSVGQTTADAMYDAGKNASKGFLAGLMAEEKALQAEMNRLGEGLIRAIKKALKIHSPSQRARDEVGKQFGRGVVQGMDHSLVDVRAAGARMSAAAISAAWGGPSAHPAAVGGGQFTGELYLDSGVFLGAVHGTVQPLIRESEQRQAYRARVGRR